MRALVFVNRALMGRSHMEEQADNWLKEAGTLPPGNGVEKDLWEVRSLPGPLICYLPCFGICTHFRLESTISYSASQMVAGVHQYCPPHQMLQLASTSTWNATVNEHHRC